MSHPNVGSIIQLAPADGTVSIWLWKDGEQIDGWEAPLVGYALVVTWSGRDDRDASPEEYETRIAPAFIHDGHVLTSFDLRDEFGSEVVALCGVLTSDPEPDPWGHLRPPEPIPDGAPMPEELRRVVNAHIRRPTPTTRKYAP